MTEMERRHGRLMRAPDHPAADPAPTADRPPPADPAPADPAPSDPPPILLIPATLRSWAALAATQRTPQIPPTLLPILTTSPPTRLPTLPPEKYELTAPEGLEINDEVLMATIGASYLNLIDMFRAGGDAATAEVVEVLSGSRRSRAMRSRSRPTAARPTSTRSAPACPR
jgi:hypothetical protein